MNATQVRLVVLGAVAVLVSGYMHFYLYFWGGYRGISIDRVLGIDISRSFALNAVAGLVIAELLVMSLRWEKLAVPAALLGVLFAAGAIVGYILSRTSSGLLGFSESSTTAEAVIAKTAEIVALISLGAYLVTALRTRRAPVVAAA